MPFLDVKLHATWGTKRRVRSLTPDVCTKLFDHIKGRARERKIFIDRINGDEDHIHCLFNLPATITIADCIQLFKGESSRWINKEQLINDIFAWCVGYYARSVSQSDLHTVRAYIDNHGTGKNFAEDPALTKFLKGLRN